MCCLLMLVSCTNATERRERERLDQEELERKAHNFELEPCGDTVLCLDYGMSGVGSGSCGPQLREKEQLKETEFTAHFRLSISK